MYDITSAAILWKYTDPAGEGDFYLPEKMPTVRSPWSGKSFTARPERFSLSDVGKELKEDAKSDKAAALSPEDPEFWKAAADEEWSDEEEEGQQKQAAIVLWKYTDEDGKPFYLEKRLTGTIRSPYSGKSFTAKPEKDSLTDVGKDLKEKQASSDKWEEAAEILNKGEGHEAIKVIKEAYDELVDALKDAKKANDNLKKVGVGDTEATTLVLAKVMPKVAELAKTAAIVASQMKAKFR